MAKISSRGMQSLQPTASTSHSQSSFHFPSVAKDSRIDCIGVDGDEEEETDADKLRTTLTEWGMVEKIRNCSVEQLNAMIKKSGIDGVIENLLECGTPRPKPVQNVSDPSPREVNSLPTDSEYARERNRYDFNFKNMQIAFQFVEFLESRLNSEESREYENALEQVLKQQEALHENNRVVHEALCRFYERQWAGEGLNSGVLYNLAVYTGKLMDFDNHHNQDMAEKASQYFDMLVDSSFSKDHVFRNQLAHAEFIFARMNGYKDYDATYVKKLTQCINIAKQNHQEGDDGMERLVLLEADLLVLQRDYMKAVKVLDKLIRKKEQKKEEMWGPYIKRGDILFRDNSWKLACLECDKVIEDEAASDKWKLKALEKKRNGLYTRRGQEGSCIEVIDQMMKISKKNGWDLSPIVYHYKGESCRRFAEKMVQEDPLNTTLLPTIAAGLESLREGHDKATRVQEALAYEDFGLIQDFENSIKGLESYLQFALGFMSGDN